MKQPKYKTTILVLSIFLGLALFCIILFFCTSYFGYQITADSKSNIAIVISLLSLSIALGRLIVHGEQLDLQKEQHDESLVDRKEKKEKEIQIKTGKYDAVIVQIKKILEDYESYNQKNNYRYTQEDMLKIKILYQLMSSLPEPNNGVFDEYLRSIIPKDIVFTYYNWMWTNKFKQLLLEIEKAKLNDLMNNL